MTAQALDDLIYEGKPCLMQTELGLRRHPRIRTVPDAEAKAQCVVYNTTACWRGYLAEWEIRDGRLFLNGLRGGYNLDGTEPLAAEWVSGTIRIEEREVISDFWDENFNGGYPREFVIEIEHGIVVATNAVTR
jgi:hypothetical protein